MPSAYDQWAAAFWAAMLTFLTGYTNVHHVPNAGVAFTQAIVGSTNSGQSHATPVTATLAQTPFAGNPLVLVAAYASSGGGNVAQPPGYAFLGTFQNSQNGIVAWYKIASGLVADQTVSVTPSPGTGNTSIALLDFQNAGIPYLWNAVSGVVEPPITAPFSGIVIALFTANLPTADVVSSPWSDTLVLSNALNSFDVQYATASAQTLLNPTQDPSWSNGVSATFFVPPVLSAP